MVQFWGQIFVSSGMVRNFLLALISIISYLYVFIKKGKTLGYELIFNFTFVIFMFLSIIYNKNSSFSEILWVFSYFGIASLIYFFPLSERLCKFIYYLIASHLFIYFLRGVDPNHIFMSSSRNLISVILFYHMTVYYVVLYNKRKEYDILPAIFTFLLCVFSLGRAGILISFFIIIFIVLNILKKDNKINFIFLIIILFVLLFISESYLQDFFQKMFKRFEKDGLSSSRLMIYKEYLEGMDNFFNFIYGVPYSNYPLLSHFKNPHNSFLTLHSKFGLFGCIGVFYILLKYLIKKLKKRQVFEIILAFFMVLRASLDWVAFPGLFDIFFWYILLESSQKKE